MVDEIIHSQQSTVDSGQCTTDNKTYLHVKASDGFISIDEFQPEGKKRMSVTDFFRGNKI